jgi:hypothetical protein
MPLRSLAPSFAAGSRGHFRMMGAVGAVGVRFTFYQFRNLAGGS